MIIAHKSLIIMKSIKPFSRITTVSIITLSFFALTACKEEKPVSYTIPKENRDAGLSMEQTTTGEQSSEQVATNPAPTGASNKMQALPGMEEAAQAAGTFSYTVPDGWEEFPPSSGMRKANFRLIDDSSSTEVTVLAFPGDVGGTLANINRWRGQIALPPARADQLGSFTERYIIADHEGLFVRLVGPQQSILGALLPFHDYTWFIKLQGDSELVLAQEEAMKAFLDSIEMNDHSH